ncbi:Maf family protein [Thiolinea disciformis]|uniref:Maf family protein n=1 Tax=Thiolinea disciformis TaxID=125614 RepID=UPI00035F7A9E|nr:Maf family protein [Thiolinea disciformis]
MAAPQLILASGSPRRRELLDQIGVRYQIVAADIDETPFPHEAPDALALRLAREKAQWVWQQSDKTLPVLGADTHGVLDGQWLMKPKDEADACAMLLRMSGRSHDIYSAVVLCFEDSCLGALSRSRVWFRHMQEAEIAAYWASGEPRDKAGAYAIQGLGAVFVERLEGSYSGVMGLPLFETANLLKQFGLSIGSR